MIMRIQEIRREKHISQKQLAAELGVTQGIVSNWENEIVLPLTRKLPALASALGCKIGDLFWEEAR